MKNLKTYNATYKFTRGKWKGSTVEYVAWKDPEYIKLLIYNGFRVSKRIKERYLKVTN